VGNTGPLAKVAALRLLDLLLADGGEIAAADRAASEEVVPF
jgi:hypothetical protein